MADQFIMALDQGTTSTRAILFDETGTAIATAQKELMILKSKGAELGLTKPLEMFWATGALSSFLEARVPFYSMKQVRPLQPHKKSCHKSLSNQAGLNIMR